MSQAILPIPGVPDDLIRILNDRFRELSGGGSVAGKTVGPGLFFQTKSRPDANGTAVGTFGSDIDTGLLYQVQTVRSAQVWVYASGIMRAALASLPTVGLSDAGLLWWVTDYTHLLRWNGTAWEFADEPGGYIAGRVVAPDGTGWQLCDGSGTTYLQVAAGVLSEQAFATPSLVWTPGYLKWGAAYTGNIIAANPPSTPSKVGQGTGSNTAVSVISADAQPAHLELLPYFRR